ncbi:protein PFC0760c-like [Pectinophora gossypiella]|uniref:protein PFC0760c-like n=1 Tax=Pectinophora gossypiella TaxID=13191 RepID=UPI00214ED865|nr:protein PFC0760c-like [Pectinophora gossypiella]
MKAVVWVGVFALTVAVPIEVRVVPDKDSEIKRQIFTWLQREYIANDGDLSKISQQSSPEDFRIESYIYENSIPTFVVTTNDNKRYKIRIKKKDVIRKDVYENLAYIQPEHKVAQSIHSYSSYKFSPAYKTYLEYNEVDVGTPLTEAEVLSIRQSQSTQSGKSTYWVNFGQYFGLDTTKPKDFRIAKDLQLLVTSSKIINQNEEAALANIKAIYDKELRGKDFNVKWDTEGRFNFLKVISKKYIEHPQERDIKLQIKNRGIVKQIFLKTSLEPDDISIVQHPSKENKIKYLTKLSEYVDLDINNPKNIEVLQNLFIILLSELKSNSNMNFKTAALKVKNMYEKEIGRNNFDLKLNNVDGKKYLEIDVKKSVDDNYDIKDDDSHINDDENNDNDTYEDKNNNIDNIDYIKNVDIKNGSDYGNIDDISDDNIENDSDYGKIDNISDDDIKNDSDNVTIDDISDDDIKNDRDNGDIDDISDDEYKINGDKGKIDDSSDDDIKNDRDNGVIDDISDDEYKINGDKSKIDDSSDDDIEKDSKDDNNDYTRDNSYIIGEISDYDGNKDYIETNPLVNYNIEYNNVNNEHIEGDNTGDNDEHYDNNYDSKQKYYNAYTYVIGNKRGVKYKNDVENGYPTPIQDSRPMIDTVEDDSSHSGLYHRSPNNDNTKSIEDRKDIEINGKHEQPKELWWSFYDRLGMDINNEQDNEIFKYLYLIIMSQAMENDSGVVDAISLIRD